MDWTETFPPWVIFAVVTLAGVLLVVIVAMMFRRRLGDSFPYTRQLRVLSPEQLSLLDVLQQAVDGRALLLARLRVADVLAVRHGLQKRRSAAALRRIAGWQFDFVLCARADARPLVAVEMEQPQAPSARRRRDRFLDEACRAAGLGLLRVAASETYAADELREQLRPHIEKDEASQPGDFTPDGRREPILDLPYE